MNNEYGIFAIEPQETTEPSWTHSGSPVPENELTILTRSKHNSVQLVTQESHPRLAAPAGEYRGEYPGKDRFGSARRQGNARAAAPCSICSQYI